ncbi:hypothetical protein [Streptomyces sp. A5-4]|uniref:hypothetical protein n=1 Tax=Streptomyces sp. A5-4 TaxID=3384771 RepID=UPI003DA9B8A3
MPDYLAPTEALSNLTTEALDLHRALRGSGSVHVRTLAARITEAQTLSGNALRLLLTLAQDQPRSRVKDLLLLERVAQIAKAGQDAGAELAAALARTVENQRRCAGAASGPVVLIGPSPQQFIESAADLLDCIPAHYHAIYRDGLLPPNLPTHQPS